MKKFNSVFSVLVLAAMIFATTSNAQLRVNDTKLGIGNPNMSR
jgi:hypothetical protein